MGIPHRPAITTPLGVAVTTPPGVAVTTPPDLTTEMVLVAVAAHQDRPLSLAIIAAVVETEVVGLVAVTVLEQVAVLAVAVALKAEATVPEQLLTMAVVVVVTLKAEVVELVATVPGQLVATVPGQLVALQQILPVAVPPPGFLDQLTHQLRLR